MIRQAVENDVGEILKIYNDAILNTTGLYIYKAQTLEEKKAWYKKKHEDGYPLFVFEEAGKVVGFATFGSFRSAPAYKYTIEHSVYVDKEYRCKGIGTALLKKVISTAKEMEYATIVGGIDAANEDSIRLHVKLGFSLAGIINKAGFKFGKWLDLAFYQLNLEGPKTPVEG